MSIRQGSSVIAGGIPIDNTPTSSSTNAVSSGGVYTALSGKADTATTLAGYSITDGANTDLSNITSAGKEVCADMAMPSSRVDTLTAVVSGGQFTAPADGYFVARATAPAAGRYLELTNSLLDSLVHSGGGGLDVSVFIPVQKGQVVSTYYSTNTPTFRFIYAQGVA